MIKKAIVFIVVIYVCFESKAYSQDNTDTSILVREFYKVLSFSGQPDLYYTSTIKINADPVLSIEDNSISKGMFYKDSTTLYSSNGKEEIFLKDSLLIRINTERKSIWISYTQPHFLNTFNTLPVSNQQFEALLNKNFTIRQTKISNAAKELEIVAAQHKNGSQTITTKIQLRYLIPTYLPTKMIMEITLKEPFNSEVEAELKSENIKKTTIIKTIGGIQYLVRQQSIQISFSDMGRTNTHSMQVPLWSERVALNKITKKYEGKGMYKNYEIIQTF